MFENSSEETAYHKLLILYILYKIKMDLTNSQITQVVLETEMMNYFSLQQLLSQLMESKFLKIYKDSDKEYYCLTQKGLETLESLMLKIPIDSANKVDHYIKLNKESLLAETQVKSSFVKQSENEFIMKQPGNGIRPIHMGTKLIKGGRLLWSIHRSMNLWLMA